VAASAATFVLVRPPFFAHHAAPSVERNAPPPAVPARRSWAPMPSFSSEPSKKKAKARTRVFLRPVLRGHQRMPMPPVLERKTPLSVREEHHPVPEVGIE
jgi:hypothetical protein